ncbi:MAG TPA: outer membrane protein transport protein [Rhodocyclaceae bacterium]|nr:outer membrane protein transport protein [Rhodocyclaceae bacterium]
MKVRQIVLSLAIAGLASPAFATDGYFSDGYGMKAKGMAGVSIALPQDALAAANNPAGMVMVGDRVDFGVDWFRPTRGADVVGNQAGLAGSYNGNDKQNFIIPEFGYNKMLGWDMSVGVSVYGNGGMNTRYATSPFTAWGVTGPTGINLEQLFVAPTFAMKANKSNALGVSLVFAQQRFGATGLQPFVPMSSSQGNVTDRGNDTTTGWGARLGWTGQVSDAVTLGATYASKIKGKFSNYSGLFADQGEFDIPENYGVGIAVKATPLLTVAADVKQINYSKSHSVGNPIDSLLSGVPLGATNGPGFGYHDVTVYKLAGSYAYSKDLTLRAGYSYNKQPIPSSQTFFNILAPAVVEDHLTFGATWTLANHNELTFAYMHAFNKNVAGVNSIAPSMGGGNANLHMYEDSLGIAYGIKL